MSLRPTILHSTSTPSSTSNTIINGNGCYVGIGTNNPVASLHVNGTALIGGSSSGDPNVSLNSGGVGGTKTIGIYYQSGSPSSASADYGVIQAGYGGSYNTNLALDPGGGKVGIGTTSPIAPLQILSSTYFNPSTVSYAFGQIFAGQVNMTGWNANGMAFSNVSTGSGYSLIGAANDNIYVGHISGTTAFVLLTVAASGNATLAGTLTQNSDARLKRDITVLPDALEKLALIKGVSFYWKDKGRDPRQQVGVIAQDVQKAYPQRVSADPSGTLSVNYNGLVAPLIEATKQLKAENDTLKQELAVTRQQVALDHDLLFKIRQHIALTDYQQTPYTESAWQYAPPPKGWKPPVPPAHHCPPPPPPSANAAPMPPC